MITPGQLYSVFPKCQNPGVWCRIFDQMVDEFDLRAPARLAMFLAQTGYESESFNTLRERMSYRTPAVLMQTFPREFPTEAAAMPYVLNPQGLANFVYAGKLGNGDVASGDGFRFRGGGLIEITGRGQYKQIGDALGLDLETRPMQIEQNLTAARTAGWWWKEHNLNTAADDGEFDMTTHIINGAAMEGANDRKALWLKLQAQNIV